MKNPSLKNPDPLVAEAYVTRGKNVYLSLGGDSTNMWQKLTPYGRVAKAWIAQDRNGLTPLSYAGIAGKPPLKVLEEMCKENNWTLDYCFSTFLPILILESHGNKSKKRGIYNMYDENVMAARAEFEYDAGECPCGCGIGKRALGKRAKEPMLWKEFAEKFFGDDWEKHATRNFNPFNVKKCNISVDNWDWLNEAYWLVPFKGGKPMTGKAADQRHEKLLADLKKKKEGIYVGRGNVYENQPYVPGLY